MKKMDLFLKVLLVFVIVIGYFGIWLSFLPTVDDALDMKTPLSIVGNKNIALEKEIERILSDLDESLQYSVLYPEEDFSSTETLMEYVEMRRRQSNLSRKAYNEGVAVYNELMGHFPYSVTRKFVGSIEKLDKLESIPEIPTILERIQTRQEQGPALET